MAVPSQIVTISATVTPAPTPSTLQQSVAFISVGATTPLVTNALTYTPTLAAATAAIGSGGNHAEVTKMATTYFAQGEAVGAYILELGNGLTSAQGVTALEAWITANPNTIYAFLLPATWDTDDASGVNSMAGNYSSASGKTYFVTTTTTGHLSTYTNKAAMTFIPAPTASGSEFGAAALLYNIAVNTPSSANPVPPLAFRFVYGVTPWVLANNSTTIATILTGKGNIFLTGSEGNISNVTIRNGMLPDGAQFMFWYAVDWLQIQSKIALAAAVIDGSNENPPLYYNQSGINQLLAVLVNLGNTGVADGLLLDASFSAVSFSTYTTENPSDYAAGIYNGLSCVATPQLGFIQIEFFIDATQFVS